MIRVLVLGEHRSAVGALLSPDPTLEILEEPAHPTGLHDRIERLNPDLVLIDADAASDRQAADIRLVMQSRPLPIVVMFDSGPQEAQGAIQALEAGAIDCVCREDVRKPGGAHTLIAAVRRAARIRPRAAAPAPHAIVVDERYEANGDVVVIGGGVGGVPALQTILAQFPTQCPPTLVAQILPPRLTQALVERLDGRCGPYVYKAEHGMPLKRGHIYLAPGDVHLEAAGSMLSSHCRLVAGSAAPLRPSINGLFQSVGRTFMRRAAGVILSGQGRDGAEGLLALRNVGARTFGQDEATSAVYGMPRVAAAIGAVQRQAPSSDLALLILRATDRRVSPFAVGGR